MAPSGKQVGQLGLVAAAFLAGRWTHSSGAGSPPQAALSDVAPEERHLLYTPPAGHGAVEVSLTLTRSLTVARNPIPHPSPHPNPNPNQVSTTTSSVLRDVRGEIHNLRIGAARFNVLASRAGAMRSGDVHRSRQLDLVSRGLLTLTLTLTLILTLTLTLSLTLTLALALALTRSSVACVRSPPARPGAMCGRP